MATFTGASLLTAKHGSAEIGLLDPTFLAGQKAGILSVLLAGRSWDVREIDWRRRLVWVEPGQGGGKARWIGSGRGMSAELATSIRTVLRTGEIGAAALSKRASKAFAQLRDDIPVGADNLAVQEIANGRFRVWTYAGTLVNRTLLLGEKELGALRCDGLSIDFSSDPRGVSIGIEKLQLSAPICRDLIRAVKFSDLLSEDQAMLLARGRFIAESARVSGVV
jgi:ATP-dependent helicase Lhr and Lhr-like helicase